MKLGKANYGSQKKIFKIVDGDNVYRILPPMGDLADKGIWAKYYAVVWGYKNSQGKNKPFVDPSEKNRSNGMLEHVSAALDRRLKLEEQKEKMKKAGATKEQLDKMNEILMQFNIEKKFYVNAVNLKGEIGLLKVGYKVHQALTGDKQKGEKGLIDRLLDKGIDPISSLDNGRFFNFHRQGKGLSTTYTVTVYQENVEVQGEIYQKDKVSVIDDVLIGRLEKEAFNLATLYPSPSLAEVERIVKEGPTAVDAILSNSNQSASEEMSDDDSTVDTSSLKQETKSESAPVETKTESAPPVETKAESAPVETKTETAPPVEEKKTEAAPAKDANDLDPDAFLKSMGVDIG